MRYADKGTKGRAFAERTSVRYTKKGAKPENESVEKVICILQEKYRAYQCVSRDLRADDDRDDDDNDDNEDTLLLLVFLL